MATAISRTPAERTRAATSEVLPTGVPSTRRIRSPGAKPAVSAGMSGTTAPMIGGAGGAIPAYPMSSAPTDSTATENCCGAPPRSTPNTTA